MPDFQHVKTPVFSPTTCVACWTHTHPDGFIDLRVEVALRGYDEAHGAGIMAADGETVPTHGHLYLCANCVREAGKKVGCLHPDQAAELASRLGEAGEIVDALEAQIAEQEEHRPLTLEDLREFVSVAPGHVEASVATEHVEAKRRRSGR